MFENEKKVYDLLQDEESKQIFLNKLLFNITSDCKYVDRMVKECIKLSDIERNLGKEVYRKDIDRLYKLINKRRVIIYGAGSNGLCYAILFSRIMKDADVAAFCDKKAEKQNYKFYGFDVIDFKTLIEKYQDCIVIITPQNYKTEIYNALIENNFNADNIYKDLPFDLDTVLGQYFDDKIIKFGQNEIFADAGCFDCGTDIEFIKRCPKYKKIIAFEPDINNIETCRKAIKKRKIRDIEIKQCGLWDKKDILRFNAGNEMLSNINEKGDIAINVDAMDSIIKDDKITFLKMDIEGSELKALHGARKIIQRDKPKLAICVYHKPEDIIEIPLYINSLVPEYKFYMRHYGYTPANTVLYAIIQ